MRPTRRTLALLVGVALPVLLLAAGWSTASWRERESMRRERLAFLERSADAIRIAVDESLTELGTREDARPFYLYNHYYSPPDVLAVSDPIAISPLAQEPDDPRVRGYFQIDPDGTLRTPYEADPTHEPGPRSRTLTAALSGPAFDDLRTLAHGSTTSGLVPVPVPAGGAEVALVDARTRAEGEGGRGTRVDADLALSPEGPLTVSLNEWGQQVYSDVSAAQQGDPEANLRVQSRGRTVPQTVRNVVDWDTVDNPVAEQAQRSSVPSSAPVRRRRASVRRAPAPPREPPAPRPPPLPVIQENEIRVDYTPMAFLSSHGSTTLQRVVSHAGTSVVQGALIDRNYVFESWIPEVAERAGGGLPILVIPMGDETECAVRRPASELIGGADLCVEPTALASVTAQADRDMAVQLAALFGLLLIVGFAAFVVDRAARRAEELSRQKSDFVSAVSHELRTPLTTIRMHSEMLRDGMVSEAKIDRFHEDLVNESVRLSQLVDNVLELSRIERGQRRMKLTEGDLGAFVEGVIEGQRRFLEDKGVTVHGPELDSEVRARFDRQAVEQIVINLLANAAKYGRGAEGVIDVRLSATDDGAELSVLDRGPGIPESEREAVFERFHRVEREETAHMPGTGIGLALVRELARAHGGDATVHPRDGGGCEVAVRFRGASSR